MAGTKEPSRVALVTGGARRIGRAIALALADRGYDIGVHYHRSERDAHQTKGDVKARGRRCELLAADLTDAAAAASLGAQCLERFGRLDVLVNNAASFDRMSLASFDPAAWNRSLAVNLTAPTLVATGAAPLLSRGGSIVNLTDISAARPWPGYLAYCAAKAGLAAVTTMLAKSLAPAIRVNAVAPGLAAWPDDMPAETRQRLVEAVPAKRAGTPEEVAAAVCFLAVDATYLTGVTLAVDGGRSLVFGSA